MPGPDNKFVFDLHKLRGVYDTLKNGGYRESWEEFKNGVIGNDKYKTRKRLFDDLKSNNDTSAKNYEDFVEGLRFVAPAKPKVSAAPKGDLPKPTSGGGKPADGSEFFGKVMRGVNVSGSEPIVPKRQNYGGFDKMMTADGRPLTGDATDTWERKLVRDHGKEAGLDDEQIRRIEDGLKVKNIVADMEQTKHDAAKIGRSEASSADLAADASYHDETSREADRRRRESGNYNTQVEFDRLKNNNPLIKTWKLSDHLSGVRNNDEEWLATGEKWYDENEGVFKSRVISNYGNEYVRSESVDEVIGRLKKESEELGRKVDERQLELYGGDKTKRTIADATATLTGQKLIFGMDPQLYHDDYGRSLAAAKRKIDERIETLEGHRDDPGFWAGVGERLSSRDWWTLGASDVADLSQDLVLKQKIENGEELSDADVAYLRSSMYADRDGQFYGKRGFLNRAGKLTADAIPFVAEFVFTGGGMNALQGATKLGMKAATQVGKNALKRAAAREAKELAADVTKDMTKGAAKKALGTRAKMWLLKNTGVVADDLARAGVMANTVGAGRTAGDAIGRYVGSVGVDDEGKFVYEGGVSAGEAMLKAEVGNTLEYYTEMLGNHLKIGDWVAKGTEKIGAGKLSKAIKWAGSNKWLEKGGIQDLPSEGLEEEANIVLNSMLVGDNKLSDLWDGETQADIWGGMALSVGFMRSVAAAHEGYVWSRYKMQERKVERADVVAGYRFGDMADWSALKERIDGTTNEDMKGVVMSIMNDDGLHAEQKKAALDYVGSLMQLRGYNLGSVNDANDKEAAAKEAKENGDAGFVGAGEEETENVEVDMEGGEAPAGPDAPTSNSETAALPSIDDGEQGGPVGAAFNRGREADAQERQDIAIELTDPSNEEAQEAWNGVVQRINEDADLMVSQQRAQTKEMQHKDGNVRPAILKEKDSEGNDQKVYIVDGNVEMMPDGSMVDKAASDNIVVVYNPATGERKQIDPTADDGISSLGEVTTAEQREADIELYRQAYVQAQIDEAQGTVRVVPGQQLVLPTGEEGVVVAIDADGEDITVALGDGRQATVQRSELQRIRDEKALADYRQRHGITEEPADQQAEGYEPAQAQAEGRVAGAPADYTTDMELTIRDEDGSEKPVMVAGRVRAVNRDGRIDYVLEENGPFVEYYVPGEDEPRHERPEELNGKVVSYVAPHQPEAAPVEEASAETPATVETTPPSIEQQAEAVSQPMQTEEPMPAQPAIHNADESNLDITSRERVKDTDPMPVREDGEEDWQATTPERAHAYIFNEAGLSRSEGNEFIAAQIQAAQSALMKASSANMPKVGTSIRKYNEAKAKRQEKIDEAQRVLDYWNSVREIQNAIAREENERRAAEDAARHEEAVAQVQAEYEARKRAEAERKAVGHENPMPAITDKWNNATKVDGHSDEIILPDGTALKGHYVLHESGASSPSHNPVTWQKTEGFPMDVNGGSVNDRDYERDLDAQEHTQRIAREYDQRALQNVPVVSNDGVVLSGNGRTMAGELAARDNTDGAYVNYLKEYAPKFGFTAEQVGAMQHPRVSFVPDEAMPYTAETFAKFNQQEMKSQNKTEMAVKLGKTVSDDSFKGIVRTINGYETLGDFYNDADASLGAVYDLHNAGVVPQAQLAEMVDGVRGQEKLSAVGREFLENMLIGKAFEGAPDVVRMLTAEPLMRQTVITALGEIVDNIALGGGWSLQGELADAVKLCFDARQGGAKYGEIVSTYARQGVLFADPDELQTVADFNNATMLMLADVLNDKRVTLLKTTLQLYNNNARESASGQADMFAGGVRSREDILRDVINFINENYGKRKEIEAARAAAVERRKAEGVVAEDKPGGTRSITSELGSTLVGTGIQQNGTPPAVGGESEDAGRSERGTEETPTERELADNLRNRERQRQEKILPNLGNKYSLSAEQANNGELFYQDAEGNTNLAVIPDEIFERLGLSPVPFKLTETMGWHVYDHHAKEAKLSNIGDAIDFVLSIIKNVDHVRLGRNNSYIFSVENGRNKIGKRAVTIVVNSETGEFMGISTSGYETLSKLKERPLLWERGADFAPEDVATPTISTIKSQQGDETLSRTKGQSNASSEGKGKVNSSTAQAKGVKVAENQSPSGVQGAVDAAEGDVNTESTEAQNGEAGKDANGPTVLRLNGEEKSVGDIEDTVMGHVQRIIDEGGFDAEIVGVKVIGSYMRGEQTSESDLDVLVEYRGKAKEDALFDAIAEEGLEINGVNVDINPITKGKSGTIEEFIKRNAGFSKVAKADGEVNTEPTEAQKQAGNYKKGHVKIDGFDVTIENPKGSVRRGTDASGKQWEQEMHNTYGYIRGTEGVDGDHIDVFLSDEPSKGDVFVVDQVNKDGTFDEHKVMYGFPDIESARKAYLSNYEDGWTGLGAITPVSKEEFKKWVKSSRRKTKPFAEYSSVKPLGDIQLGEKSNKPTVKLGEDYVSAAERIAKEHEVKRTAAHFAEETQEEATAFDKRVPEMDDVELLAYMQEDGRGDLNKAHHPSVYDEYDYRHGDEQLRSYDDTLVRLNESGTTLEQAEDMLANIRRDKSLLATDRRAELLGQEDALQDYIVELKNREDQQVRQQKGSGIGNISPREAALRDALVDVKRGAGVEVVTDVEEGQRELDEVNGEARLQAMIGGLQKASDFIVSFLKGKTKQRSSKLEIPERANRLAERAIGHKIKSHTINANELTHSKKRHGINGSAITEKSIPLRDEDFALMPYIMSAPTRVVKGSTASNGTESVRYEKELPNGVVVVVEREGKFDIEEMENITMWAEKKSATNVTVAQRASHSTSGTIVISEADAAKIRKDAEDAIRRDEYLRFSRSNGVVGLKTPSPVFYSNAERAVMGISQKKATAEQWLAMIKKLGGIKAGEDKWLGLSDWLESRKGESVTKDEVLGFIRENRVEIEEVDYSADVDVKDNERMKDLQQEFEELMVEAEEATGSIYTSELADWAFERMVDRYGDDFDTAFYPEVENGEGRLVANRDYDGMLDEAARYFLGFEEGGEIHPTRLDYTTDGLEHKKEIAFTVPTIAPWHEEDAIHFGDAGGGRAVAWVRFGETTDGEGRRVLVIDEIQSNRHQEGREKGYVSAGDIEAARNALAERELAIRKRMSEIDARMRAIIAMIPDDVVGIVARSKYRRNMPENEEYLRLDDEREALSSELSRMRREVETMEKRLVPDAPFEKNWHEMVMKRMLRYAAEMGYDKVAWTKGAQQAERYELGRQVDEIRVWDNSDGVNTVVGIKDGQQVFSRDTQGGESGLAEVVGKDMARKAYSNLHEGGDGYMTGDGYVSLRGKDLSVGGVGMRGFYDEILPRFMDKYGKKWGVKTEDVELPKLLGSARVMHAVDVTDAMKESVMEGQPMFFRTKDGRAYGFVKDGRIYIDPRIATAETPIHEYCHLWASAMRELNPKEWRNIVELMKGTAVWDDVKRLYPELKTDDAIGEEVLAHYSGRRGAGRLRAEQEKILGGNGDVLEKAAALSAIGRVKEALKRFWKGVADWFGIHFTSAEEVADKVLSDLLNGVNPVSAMKSERGGVRYEANSEEAEIVAKAKADGTYMKAPNGNASKLSPRQWVQVRTRAFKEWFGDWEKRARIEKLRNSEPIVRKGDEYKGRYELNSRSAEDYVIHSLRGEYPNNDTGDVIRITRASRKVAHHDAENEVHLRSIAYIPEMIKNAVFIEERVNEKSGRFDSYRYYVVGLKIGGVDYTAKLVVGVKGGESYYDHSLTEIEKNNLIDLTDGVKADVSGNEAANFTGKDKRLLSILQTNSSKVVDENGEPRVVYHQTNSTIFVNRKTGENFDNLNWKEKDYWQNEASEEEWNDTWEERDFYVFDNKTHGRRSVEMPAFFFSPVYDEYHEYGDRTVAAFLNIRNPIVNPDIPNRGVTDTAGEDAMNALIAQGYDGFIREYDGELDEINAFFPNQIKSADENVGTFDGANPDIRYQFVGERGAAAMDKAEEAGVRLDNLAVAREMESAGKDAKAVKLATGWERGADGKWRYEIEDGSFDRSGELHPERRRLSSSEQKELDDAFFETMDAFEKGSLAYKEEITEDTDMADIYEAGGMERKKAERIRDLEDKEHRLKGEPKKLDDYLENDELFNAYPQLREIVIDTSSQGDAIFGKLGSYDLASNTIRLNDTSLSTLTHEVQHAIQEIEGFARGGSVRDVRKRIMKRISELDDVSEHAKEMLARQVEYRALASKLGYVYERLMKNGEDWAVRAASDNYWEAMNTLDNDENSTLENSYPKGKNASEIAKEGFNRGKAIEELKRLSDYYASQISAEDMKNIKASEALSGKIDGKSNKELYHALGGEVEARNVQARLGLSAEERRASLASETEDVAREDQLFLEDGLGVGASARMDAGATDVRSIAQRMDEERGTEVARFVDFLRRGKLGEGESRYFHVGDTGGLLNEYGISGKITVSSSAANSHHNKDKDHLSDTDWVDVFDKINEPIAITRYGDRPNSFRIYTIVEKNGKNICVGVDVNSVGRNVNITNIKTGFARDIANALNEELVYPGSRQELETAIQERSLRHNREVYPEQPYDATKVVEEIEVPKVWDEKNSDGADEAYLANVNSRFNERLMELLNNPKQKARVLHLGIASKFLQKGGISNAEIILEYDKVVRKSKEDYKNDHPFSISDIKNLPLAIHHPIAVFDNTNGKDAGRVILTELKKDGRNFIVVVRAREQHRKGGVLLEINEISTLYPKEAKGILKWIIDRNYTNIDKEKALRFIEELQPHAGTTIKREELVSAAKVVEDFENARMDGGKVLDSGYSGDSGYREAVNARFNAELGRLTEENKDKVVLSLGRPSAVLLSAGVKDKSMKLYGNKVIKKMKKHGFALDELRDLPRAVADPIAVFDNYQLEGNRTVLTELQSKGENIMVAVTLGKDGVDVDFNIVSSVFGKGEDNIVDWLNKGYARYINKEKALNYLHHSDRHISEALSNPKLVSAAKVVEDFVNPVVVGEENDVEDSALYRIREGAAPTKTGIGYKVFVLKDGKLYPPMVANPGGEATPVGVWLDADAAPVAGVTKTGRQQVKAGGKGTQGGSGKLSYRPGWHLGEIPYALQFNRLNPETGQRELFPANFVWAEVEYANDVDYQEEAMSYGMNASGKFQHSLAGLPRLPENGSYRYRTNPNPETDPWVITGAMKVNRILKPSEVDAMVEAAGREPQQRQAGAVTDEQVDALNATVKRTMQEDRDMMRSAVEQMGEKLHTEINIIEGVNEITHPNAAVQERRRKSKGWYDTSTGQVNIVLDNNRDVDDVKASVGHETIAHKGLRELVGEENYDEFLDETYQHLRDDLKQGVDAAAGRAFVDDVTKNGKRAKSYEQHRRTAVDELFGKLAEKPFEEFTDGERTLWQKLKAAVRKLLDKFLGTLKLPKWFELGDNELRYILWRSKERLERGREHPIDLARDIVKREELGLTDEARYNMGDAPETFKARQERAVENNGTVMPGLNDAQVKVVGNIPRHPYTGNIEQATQQAIDAAKAKYAPGGEPKPLPYKNFGVEFSYTISGNAIGIVLSAKHQGKSVNKGVHLALAEYIDRVIGESIEVEEHPDRIKTDDVRDNNKINPDALMHRFYGVARIDGKDYRVMTLMKEENRQGESNGIHSYEVQKIEVLDEETPNTPNGVGTPNSELEAYPLAKVIKDVGKTMEPDKKLLEESKIADESTDLYRDSDDVWTDGSMGLQERMTAAATRLANNHREDKTLRNDAMRAIGGNLADLRKAMSLQRTFDRTTVKRVADLARVLITNGYINNATSGEIKRLLSVVKNSVGHNDIEGDVQKVMDIMVDNQLKHAEETLHELEAIKGSKVDARGVEVQGQLDAEGQTLIKSMKEAQKIVNPCGGKTHDENGEPTAWGNALESAIMRMSSNDQAVADAAAIEYAGMQMAQQWFDTIQQSKLEEQELRQELKSGYVDDSGNPIDDPQGKREWRASIEEAIRQNKIERVQAYYELVGRLTDSLRESLANAKDFKEAEQQRIREIQHNANSDMEGRPSDEHQMPANTRKKFNNWMGNSLFAPLATYMEMLRLFGRKSANGEGYLFNRFGRGWIDARQQEIRGVRDKYAILDAKAAELFGGQVKTWGDLIRRVGKLPKGTVSFWNGGEMKECEMTQGNLMYIYMVNKMLDGRMKLRKMGISEEDVAEIERVLDPRLIELADWMQDEFLVQTRNEYNETHKRMFGASMAAIEHYFPLRVLKNAIDVKAEDLDKPEVTDGISTITGGIIKRRRNSKPLDILNADALHVILSHVAEMEHWNAYAEFNRDLNTLRSYRHFRNQVQNMNTIYGNGKNLWEKFNDVCQMATGAYKPKGDGIEKAILSAAQGVTAAKVSFRIFTALKQFASLPAYFPYVRADYLVKSMARPDVSWSWCMEHLPIFEERWKSRVSGDPRLAKSILTAADWRQNLAVKVARAGMAPNAFVDALTVSMGAYAVYQTRKGQYLRDGYSEEQAERRAIQDTEMVYNETQQSGESAFTSTMQTDRTWWKVMFSVFRNSSMAYQRQLHGALRDLGNIMKEGGVSERLAFMKKQMIRDGLSEEQADAASKRRLRRQLVKDGLAVATFGYIMQLAWNMTGYLPYLLFGDDDETKDEFWDDIWAHTMGGWLEGLTGGDVMSLGIGMWRNGEVSEWKLKKEMPLTTDLYRTGRELFKGEYGAFVTDAVNLCVQMGLGVNPQSITDGVLAIMDACGDDPALAHEATICISRILQVPQSQIDKMYFDEVGLSGDEVSKYTPAQLAERYAEFKVKRGRFFSPWSWDDEDQIGKFTEKANKTINERTEQMGDKKVNEAYLRYEEVYKGVKSARKALEENKIDYVKYAEMMRSIQSSIQSDTNAFETYQMFKPMDGYFNEIVKLYLGAKTPDEAALCRQAVLDYKSAMVKVLEAPDVSTRDEAIDSLRAVMQDFADAQSRLRSAE